ncbi:MAG: HPr family phosphocarrier protein [Clostridia bacterium]|nr:HPr family phosphocarrier protein [Clostridia bacterium]
MVKAIEMKTLDDAKRINRIATKCPFDIFVESRSIRVNAKSLLGLMILLGKQDLMLVASDRANAKEFAKLTEHLSVGV